MRTLLILAALLLAGCPYGYNATNYASDPTVASADPWAQTRAFEMWNSQQANQFSDTLMLATPDLHAH